MLGLLFGTFFILLALGVPILFSMGIAAGIYYFANGYPLMQFVQKNSCRRRFIYIIGHSLFFTSGRYYGKRRYQ